MTAHLLIFSALAAVFAVSLHNLLRAPRLEKLRASGATSPKVSVLIPARNEGSNIGECVARVFSLNYRNMEVIVYDDASTDNTGAVLEKCRLKYPGLKVVTGAEKPRGWTGKTWACHNLGKASAG